MAGKDRAMAKKKTSIKISNIALIVALILIFAYFLSFGIRNVTVCNNIKFNKLKEYQGSVEIATENRTRNTVYFIALDNGDIVRVNSDLLEKGNIATHKRTWVWWIYVQQMSDLWQTDSRRTAKNSAGCVCH